MSLFEYTRRVAFCDTDAMGVVHHANYLRYCEEARVAWLRARDVRNTHLPLADAALAVIESSVKHLQPIRFDDNLHIQLQARRERLKIHFRYAIHVEGNPRPIATCETIHVMVNKELRPVKPMPQLRAVLEKEPWIETWPSNL